MVKSKKLNENQQLAIQLLASGKAGKAVAQELEIRNETLSRWRNQPQFQAELNAFVEDIRENARGRLLSLVDRALEIIEQELMSDELSSQRTRTAFKVLQMVGGDSLSLPQHKLPTDVEEIEKQAKEQEFLQEVFEGI